MAWALKPILQYIVYPLAIKLAGWIYNTYLINQAEEKQKEIEKQRDALNRAIENAKNDEDIINLSVVLAKLNSM